MVCFSMMLNERNRILNAAMFNDSIMSFHLFFAIYLLVIHRRPKLSALFISLGLSMKVGALLILPSFFGIVQYQHGIYNLLATIFIVISV